MTAPDPTPQPDLPPVPPLGPIPGTSGRPGPDVAPAPVWPAAASTATPTTPTTPTPATPFALVDAFPIATDPALDGYAPPTLADLGLTGDLVAMVLSLRDQAATAQARIAELIAGMTAQERADLAQYDRPTHLRAVA
ncbi:hypothetical protein [Nakamurella sp.]|uniref:hypothetical protein n=1 Tax=Nakamurella sp. TaxID=1869182 RepID=UPI003B3AA062